MTIVTLSSVTKSFHGRAIYDDASATIELGSITAIVGPNGSGKSLLFRMICGFLAPDSGDIWIDPAYLSGRRDYPDQFGIIIDRPGFVQHLTGMANMETLAGIRKRIDREDIARCMNEFGLDPALKQKVRHYSLGMRQKLALVQAFMESPRVLVLDEPFNALDADSVPLVREKILDFHRGGGTVMFTSHNNADIEQLATATIEVNNGKLIQH